jgi:sirohydrochlorin ferrochelatase
MSNEPRISRLHLHIPHEDATDRARRPGHEAERFRVRHVGRHGARQAGVEAEVTRLLADRSLAARDLAYRRSDELVRTASDCSLVAVTHETAAPLPIVVRADRVEPSLVALPMSFPAAMQVR